MEGAGLSRRVGLSFAGPGEIKRKEVVLDPQESRGEIKSREMELAGLRKLDKSAVNLFESGALYIHILFSFF